MSATRPGASNESWNGDIRLQLLNKPPYATVNCTTTPPTPPDTAETNMGDFVGQGDPDDPGFTTVPLDGARLELHPDVTDGTLSTENGMSDGVSSDLASSPASPSVSPSELEGSDDDPGEPCGWGPIKPVVCQACRNPKVVLFCLCCAAIVQGMVVNGFVSVIITSIERRFDLASTETGIIASSYDVASVLCLIPVSYLGGIGRKPRWLGTGVFLLGLGSLLFAMPHFFTGLYNYERTREHNQCYLSASNSTTSDNCPVSSDPNGLWRYKYMFILAHLLHGAGASPLYTLGVTYLDENLKPKVTPVYTGVFYAMAIVGPALGYLTGGEFLKRYTDIGAVDTSKVQITPDSPQWVGAWWVGFIITAGLAFIISVPLLGFPRSLPGSDKLRAERVSEAYQGSDSATSKPGFGTSIRDIPASLRVLLTNPTFMFLNLAGASEGMLLSGFTAFTPKFIESQFSFSAGWAAQLVGLVMIPAGGGGTFLGGYIVKKFDLKCAAILKLCLCTATASLLLLLIFLIQCPNVPFAGVNTDYEWHNATFFSSNLTSSCNQNCHCERDSYDPVCGSNGVMYFSPCYAGCSGKAKKHGKDKVFTDCSCVRQSLGDWEPHLAREGKCENYCLFMALFLPTFAGVILCTFCTSMPALSATLRCVPDRSRSFALGIQWILVRCLGTIPAPILFGSMIDRTCRLWQWSCPNASASQGSCLFYDNESMGYYLLAAAILGKGLSVISFFFSLFLYKPPPRRTVLPVVPGDPLSASSTMQMLVKDRSSVESRLSIINQSPRAKKHSPKATHITTGAGRYKPVSQL